MKTKWNLLKAIMLLTGCIITISCSNDDEKNDDNNIGQKYKIVKVKGANHSSTTWRYSYADDLLKAAEFDAGTYSSYTSSVIRDDKIVYTEGIKAQKNYASNAKYTLNAVGFLSTLKENNLSLTFTYTNDGYLQTIKGTDKNQYDTYNYNINYSWSHGNLIRQTYQINYSSGGYAKEEYSFQYDDPSPNTGIFMNDLFNGTQILDPTYFYAGLLGKTTQNIPSSLQWTFELETPYSSDSSSQDSDIICSLDGNNNIAYINISDWFDIYYEYEE